MVGVASDGSRWVAWNSPASESDSNEILIATEASGSWTTTTLESSAASTAPRIEVDGADRPHVMWHRERTSQSSDVEHVLVHAVLVDGAWNITEGPTGRGTIDMDWGPEDTLHIVTTDANESRQEVVYTELTCDNL